MNEQYRQELLKLQGSKKYAGVCPDTLERVLSECFLRYKKPKEAAKAAREKLHGITGAFMPPEACRRAGEALQAWTDGDDAALAEVLSQHASTRERLPLAAMDALYDKIFAVAGRPERILDLACGLNPIYLAARGFDVAGVDIQHPAVELVCRMGEAHGLPARADCRDLLMPDTVPRERFDLALAFKLLPLLEAQRAGAAAEVLAAVDAPFVAVSFPTRTLTGRNVGMEANYTRWMEAHLPKTYAVAARFVEAEELVYVLKRL